MLNHRISPIDRRGFFHLGALAGVFCAIGCDSGGEPKPVTSPPTTTGARKNLKMLEEKAAGAPGKKK
jgi:hypothetical protein